MRPEDYEDACETCLLSTNSLLDGVFVCDVLRVSCLVEAPSLMTGLDSGKSLLRTPE